MKLYVNTMVILGLMFCINSLSQAQESTVNTGATPPPANADTTTTTTASGQQVERVEVIGSRIKRIQKEGATAVKNVGKDSMKNSANVKAADTLRDSTAATYGGARERSGGSGAGTATIGLRGFGATRTLVLLNGHRLPNDPTYEAVDLNFIPQSAIERIEILKDGASALYGSDALGGVINIVTKKGFVGNEAALKLSRFDQQGGEVYDLSLLSGFATEKSEFMGVLSYNHKDKIQGRDREIARLTESGTGNPGAYSLVGSAAFTPTGPCPVDLQSPNGNCRFRPNYYATIQPQIAQTNLLTDYTYRLDNGMSLYNRNIISYKDIEWNYAPTPVNYVKGVTPGAPDDLPSGTASQPTADAVNYRYLEAGNRDSKDSELNYSVLVGLKGNATSTWDYNLGVGYSRVTRTEKGISGYLDKDVLKAKIAAPARTHDPAAAPGATGNIDDAKIQVYQQSSSDLLNGDLVLTGELFDMEAGPVGIATGVSLFNEKLQQEVDDLSAIPDRVLGSSGSRDSGERDVQSIFAEVAFPLTEKLELSTAARLDHYSDFGSSVNPRLSVKYNFASWGLIRSSVGTGFKAPTLSQLYGSSSDGYLRFKDNVGCDAGVDASLCTVQQYHVYGGGNKKLKEEKALSASLGTVIQPTNDISFAIDGWYTKITDIVELDLGEAIDAESQGIDVTKYGIQILRDPSTQKIISINAPNVNLASEAITGIDVSFEANLANNVLGHQLGFENEFSYVLSDIKETFPGLGERDIAGEYGQPRWRNTANLTLKNDITTYTVTLRSIEKQNIQDRFVDEKISELNEFDIAASYKFGSSQIGGGVKNVMNAKQPLDSFSGGTFAELNEALYDINGRKFFVSYTQKF